MNPISVDESGNSGGDLCNLEQTVFALSAVIVSESEARELLYKYFPREIDNHVEIKHSSILSTYSQRSKLLEIHKEILNQYCAFSQVADKSYLAIERMCNSFLDQQESQDNNNQQLVEHLWGWRYFQNADFFDLVRSFNIASDNLKQVVNEQGEKVRDREVAYQTFIRKIPTAISRYSCLKKVLGIAIDDPEHRRDVFDFNSMKSDPTTMRVLRLIVQLQRLVGDNFIVHVDRSPQYSGRLGKAIRILHDRFPRIECTDVDSHDYYAMQIADLIAGDVRCAAEYAYGHTRNRPDRETQERHGESVLELYRSRVNGGIEFYPTWNQLVRLRNMNDFYHSCS